MSDVDFDPPIPVPPAEFTEVKNAHIVPKHYLDLFANDRGLIRSVLLKDGHSFTNSTKNVAIRDEFYGRDRRDGSRIFDTEWSLSVLEGASAGLLREVGSKWPFDWQEKTTLAQFFGLQLVRGPRHFQSRNESLEARIKQVERGELRFGETEPGAEEIEATADYLLSQSQQHLDMQLLAGKVGTVFSSMTWALVRFGRPSLILGDHPVSIWPLGIDSRRPRPNFLGEVGLLNIFEVRVPVSPDTALIMFWGDRADISEPIVGMKRHSKNLNSFSVADSDIEWFCHPDHPRPASSLKRSWRSLSSELIGDYSHSVAGRSAVREFVARQLESQIGLGTDVLDEHGRAISKIIVFQSDLRSQSDHES